MRPIKLTVMDCGTLTRARDLWVNFEECGIYGHHAHMGKLERYRLLEFQCMSDHDIDGNEISERPIYILAAISFKVADKLEQFKDPIEFGYSVPDSEVRK